MHAEKPFYAYKQFMIDRYGEPLYRIPVDLGTGCPHRDSQQRGGCSFCAEDGARAVQTTGCISVDEQIEKAVLFARRRYRARAFNLYFQAFTSTFQSVRKQERAFTGSLEKAPFKAVSIGTRPDCLAPETMELLEHVNAVVETWVELGVQTVHDETLQRIHRGHRWACSKRAIRALHRRGLKVAVHVILGLPGESREHFIQTARALAELPVDGIKIHTLHVIKGSPMAETFKTHPFPVLDEYTYAEHLMEFLRYLPGRWPIMRMTTDTAPSQLIAPLWHMQKGQFVEMVTRHMTMRDIRQGDKLEKTEGIPHHMRTSETKDGSITLWNESVREYYHSPVGAQHEAEVKYVGASGLAQQLKSRDVRILDICFGLGYNGLAACHLAMELRQHHLHVTALEIDRRAVLASSRTIRQRQEYTFNWRQALGQLASGKRVTGTYFDMDLLIGDARYLVKQLQGAYDIVFLDPFSTQKNSELWTVDFFAAVKSVMSDRGCLYTYSESRPVRSGLLESGFYVGTTAAIGGQRGGTAAAVQAEDLAEPLTAETRSGLTTASCGIPYRDPHGVWSNAEIQRERQNAIVAFKKKRR